MPLSRSLVVVLAAMLGWLPVAPPEHVHAAADGDDHRVVVHQHFEAAGSASGHPAADSGTRLDHDGATLLTVHPAYAARPFWSSDWLQSTARPYVLTTPTSSRLVAVAEAAPLIHGPPGRPTALRAPPATARL